MQLFYTLSLSLPNNLPQCGPSRVVAVSTLENFEKFESALPNNLLDNVELVNWVDRMDTICDLI